MRKSILTFCTALSLLALPAKVLAEKAIGITLTAADVDTSVTDDIDSNGTVNTTKNISNSIGIPSIFFEAGRSGDRGSLTFGVAWIPLTAQWEERSATQTSLKGDGEATGSGTNKGTVDVSNHITAYIEPAIKLGSSDVDLFISLGYVTADVDAEVKSVSSTDKTVGLTLDGTKTGVGIKKYTGLGFIKLEYAEVDYDPISVTTSNSTKVTADMDTTQLSLSFGKTF